MKDIAIGSLFIAAVAFGGLYLHQARKATQAQVSADGWQQSVSDLQSSLAEKEKQTTRLREQLEETRADAAAQIQEAARLRATLQESLTNQARRATAKAAGQGTWLCSPPRSEKTAGPLDRI